MEPGSNPAVCERVPTVYVQVACPVASCARNRSFNGIAKCLCGAYLIAKPSRRRKTMDLSAMSDRPVWRWHDDPDGPTTIMVTRVVWDDRRNRERSIVEEERGFWTPVSGVVRLQPDYRKASTAVVSRVSFDPRRQKLPRGVL